MSDDADDAAREAFASAVEDYFLRRRGSARLLPPKDWTLLAGWYDAGIPLPVVLAGLAEVFDRAVAAGRVEPISSISYCRHAVQKRWEETKRLAAGGAPAKRRRRKGDDEPVDPLGSAAAEGKPLSEKLSETAERLDETAPAVASALRAIREPVRILEADATRPLSDREGELIDLERALVRELLPILPADDREAIEAEAEGRLARLRDLPSPEELVRLREIGRIRAVRHRWALPRLTLLPRG